MKKVKKNRGITLISLVVTIVVLLILAGVTIATLTGDNGILTKAQQAKEKNEKASDRDLIAMAVSEAQIGENGYQELNSNNLQEAINNQFNGRNIVVSYNGDETFTVSCLDTLKDYKVTPNGIEDGIDWNVVLANVEKHPEQVRSTAIGVGVNGRTVNMDLWEYTLLEDGTYGLNNDETFTAMQEENWSAVSMGYIGNITTNGEIDGVLPQYIKEITDDNFIPVTDLSCLFARNKELKIMPEIPRTVKIMSNTFLKCENLEEATSIPFGVTKMESTFSRCTKLTTMPSLPDSVIDMNSTFYLCENLSSISTLPKSVKSMRYTFQGCSKLEQTPNLPEGVEDLTGTFYSCVKIELSSSIPNSVITMRSTFTGCTSLKKAPLIPASVKNLQNTFQDCSSLTGIITINAKISGSILENNFTDYYCIFYNAATNDGCSIELTGICPVLEDIINNTNKDNVTLL